MFMFTNVRRTCSVVKKAKENRTQQGSEECKTHASGSANVTDPTQSTSRTDAHSDGTRLDDDTHLTQD